jgi:two-component system sensor histidine kinase DevS
MEGLNRPCAARCNPYIRPIRQARSKKPAQLPTVHKRIASRPRKGLVPPEVNLGDLLEALPDAVLMVDAEGRVVYANTLMERLSGYAAAELKGKPIEMLVPERFREQHIRHRSKYIGNPRTRPMGANLQISMQCKAGSEFPADISLSPLKTPKGVNIVAAVRDATERQRLALLDDRERIARELHDGIIQGLYAVGMTLQATHARADEAEAVRTRLDGAIESIDVAIRDLRNYIFGLRPGILADRQLNQAFRELGREFEERSGVVTIVEVDPAIAAHFASASPQLVQIAREALSNVARHARANTCRVSLMRRGDQAVLMIDDDGGGFDPASVRPGGQGLANIRERARAMGGDVTLLSTRSQGTTIDVRLPL